VTTDDSIYLMVNVMVICPVLAEHLERVPGEAIATVVVDCLKDADAEKQCCLPDGHLGPRFSKYCSDGVEEEAFHRMIVQSSIRIWHIEAVVYRVQMTVEEFVHVHGSMKEVLPSVDEEPGIAASGICIRYTKMKLT
jgi:hypothetical protein